MFRTEDNVSLFFQVIAVALCIAILIIGGLYGAWWYMTKDMTEDVFNPNVSVDINDGTVVEEQKKELTLQEKIKAWKDTGNAARTDNVTNILLIGIDVNSDDMLINSRADAMVIVSINHSAKTITLASLLRDQYCYIENGKNSKFEKLHHANAYGGPSLQITMLEKYYKVAIDNYALVNFYSLPKIIDALGGVKVNITKTEADYMNSYWGTNVKTGENLIKGDTALIYMRIRHQTGGDEARVNRQQTVIKEILNQLKAKNKTSLISLIGEISPYIRTGYSSNQLLSLATDALLNGWFSYEIKQATFPDNTCSVSFTESGIWYWKVDYPMAAQKLQLALYGKTNISLEENRKSWI